MKRAALSVVGGLVITFLYAVTTGPLSLYVKDERLHHLLWLPIGWPKVVYLRLLALAAGRAPQFGDTALLLFIIACDVALYASLTYILLLIFSHRRPRRYGEPPPPPTAYDANA